MYSICNLSLVPVRRDPSDKSEMTSQLLFGELVEVVDKLENWRKVRIFYDDYVGWVDKKQILPITEDDMLTIRASPDIISTDLFQIIIWNQNQVCPIVIGSSLPRYSNHKFHIGQTEYSFDGNAADCREPQTQRMIEHAYMFLNSPYLWGGRSPLGIDCSGFTQMVYKLCGLFLKRDAWQQAEQGETIKELEFAKQGDLAFFQNPEGRVSHVGLILPGSNIIHASGKVRIDKLDKQGIYNEEMKGYSHKLSLIKRHY